MRDINLKHMNEVTPCVFHSWKKFLRQQATYSKQLVVVCPYINHIFLVSCYDTQVGTISWFVLSRLLSWDMMNNTAIDELPLLLAFLTSGVVSV